MTLLNIGFGNMVSAERIIAVVSPDSAPIKRIIQEVKEEGMLIDASFGRSMSQFVRWSYFWISKELYGVSRFFMKLLCV